MYLLYLALRDEIENLLCQILNFEKGTRNKKGFLVIEREFSLLILTRFFEIENSRQCLASLRFNYFQRYVFESENKLVAGDHINWSKPLDRGTSTLRHLLVAKVNSFGL